MQVDKKRLRNDIVFISVILILAIVGFLIFKVTLKSGNTVLVSVNGEEQYRYSISENKEFTVKTGENGKNINTIVIEDRKVFMKEADCPDKICVRHRAISNSGETIVCLPHRVVVSVE